MAVKVNVRAWMPGTYPGGLALAEYQWQMFDIPAVGSNYWADRMPYVVRKVVDGEPPTIYLEEDANRQRELTAALPEGQWLEGGRRSDDGQWHLHLVKDGVDRPVGFFLGESLDNLVAQAVEAAQASS